MKKGKIVKVISWLDTGIFPTVVQFSMGYSYEQLLNHLTKIKAFEWKKAISEDKKFFEDSDWFALRRTVEEIKTGNTTHYFFIVIKDQFKFTDWEMCKLAHEVLHICQFMFKDILDQTVETEAVAYTHTHLMKQCLSAMRGHKINKW